MTVLEEQAVRQAQSTKWLWAGVAAGPLFVALSFAQVPFREGFDLTKHACCWATAAGCRRVTSCSPAPCISCPD